MRSKAAELEGNLDTAGWEIFEAIGKLDDERKATAQAILTEVRQALASDEHVTELAPALKGAQAKAVRLLTKAPSVKPPATGLALKVAATPGRRVDRPGEKEGLTIIASRRVARPA